MNRIVRTALLAGFSALALAAGVAASGAEDLAKIIEYRQNLMKTNGAQAADILMIIKGEVPFGAKNVVAHAEVIHALSRLILDAFPKGSGAAAGKTRAKDEIWTDWEGFTKDAMALEMQSAKLVEIAKGGDMKAIADQVAVLGKDACGACHKDFRAAQ
jgi:cytochrome c556